MSTNTNKRHTKPAPTESINNGEADAFLVKVASAYVMIASLGAAISISGNLHAEFLGHVPTTTVAADFFLPWGWGTGMSPPLILMVLVAITAGLLKARIGRLILWRWLLAIGGLLFAIGQLGEPHTYQILSGEEGFTWLRAVVIIGMIAAPLCMAAAGFRAIRYQKKRKAV